MRNDPAPVPIRATAYGRTLIALFAPMMALALFAAPALAEPAQRIVVADAGALRDQISDRQAYLRSLYRRAERAGCRRHGWVGPRCVSILRHLDRTRSELARLRARERNARHYRRYRDRPTRRRARTRSFFDELFGGGRPPRPRVDVPTHPPSRYRRGARYGYEDGYRYGNGYRSYYGSGYGYEDGPTHWRGYGTYRTLCVRLCDGYYWPVSFSTTYSRFGKDRNICRSSCASPSRLYFHRNPGGDVERMTSIGGRRYLDLPNAFRYRKELVNGCGCKPDQVWVTAKPGRKSVEKQPAAAAPLTRKRAETQGTKLR